MFTQLFPKIRIFTGSFEIDVNPLPNMGPKVNHHFRKNNAGFQEIEHPRWGLIQSLIARKDIKGISFKRMPTAN